MSRAAGLRVFALALSALILTLDAPVFAIEASPHPFQEIQPDGTKITLFIRGDEHYHWQEDPDGFTVVRAGGWFYYAERAADGGLQPSSFVVGRDAPSAAGLAPGLKPSPQKMMEIQSQGVSAAVAGAQPNARVAPLGTVKNIVILMRFADHVGRPISLNADFNVLFNSVGGDATLAPSGSVRDVYYENSYGQFTLNSTVFGWRTLPNTEVYYANGNSGLDTKIHEAITAVLNILDDVIDFNQFDEDSDGFVDAISFVHSGYAAEFGGTDEYGTPSTSRIWSHRWSIPTWTSAEGVKVSAYHINPGKWGTSGSAIGRVGVICHETGHFFGLPDLYDSNGGGSGIGSWGLMANSWGFNGSQYNPPHFCSWSKVFLGWVTPTVIGSAGVYNLPQWETNAAAYRIDQGFPSGEYLLLENRQPVGIENDIPAGGVVAFHIDDTAGFSNEGYPGQPGWPENGQHYRVAVLQADGDYDLERGFGRGDSGDTYRAGFVNALTPETVPSTDTYQGGQVQTTDISITGISAPGPTMSFAVSFGDDLKVSAPDGNDWSVFRAAGAVGGPFSPPSRVYALANTSGGSAVTAAIETELPWVEASVNQTTIGAGGVSNITLSVSPNANLMPPGEYTALATISNQGTGHTYSVDAQLLVTTPIATYNFDTDPGWSRNGAWAFGQPAGLGGDPSSGKTGSNVYGFNLQGVYNNNLPERTLTTNAVNCSGFAGVQLHFWRWLGVENAQVDHAKIQVSTDGFNFTDVWVHDGVTIDDGAWTEQWVDLSSVADHQSTVYVRWVMGTTNASGQYCGWNLDDVSVRGVPSSIETIASFNMDSDPGWTNEGGWHWGQNAGAAGDPFLGYTGINVYGYVLSGAYPDNLPERNLTSTPIDCSGHMNVKLNFWRWLTIEDSIYDHARVQASNDGVNFTDVWVHSGPTLFDTSWVPQSFDISAIADGQPTVYLRWVMGNTDSSVTYGGWNIDDVSLVGSPGTTPGNLVWVDFGHNGTQAGTQAQPYRSVTAGVSIVEDGGTVRFKGNSIDTQSGETFRLRKGLRLESTGGAVRIGVN